jgi:tol-pal system protein YbgF
MSLPSKRAVISLTIFLLAIPGCYGRRIYEIESQLQRQRRSIRKLEDSLYYMSHDIAYLDSTVGRSSAPVRTDRAVLESRMDELQTRLEILEAHVRENRYRISQFSMQRGTPGRAQDSTKAPADTTVPRASVATHIYETAYVDFVKGRFESAISGFRDFVARFPMTDFSDDAQFMIAQSYFVLGDFTDAIVEFRRVVDDYPSGDKVAEAMYKLGLCYLEIEDVETARQYFKILVSRYPTAPEALQAQDKLDSLPPEDEEED